MSTELVPTSDEAKLLVKRGLIGLCGEKETSVAL